MQKGPRGGLPGRQAPAGGAPAPSPGYNSPRNYSNYGMPSPGMQSQQGGYGGGYANTPPQSKPVSRKIPLGLAKVENKTDQQFFIFNNLCAVSPSDFPYKQDIYLRLSGDMMQSDAVVTARPTEGFSTGCISLSDRRFPFPPKQSAYVLKLTLYSVAQRTWLRVGMMDTVFAVSCAGPPPTAPSPSAR